MLPTSTVPSQTQRKAHMTSKLIYSRHQILESFRECKIESEEFLSLYLDLIEHISNNPPQGYSERHHILPQSLFPNLKKDELNIIKCSAYHHFVLHYYLAKFLKNNKMIFALNNMNRVKKYLTQEQLDDSAKKYQEFKEDFSKAISQKTKNTVVVFDKEKQIYFRVATNDQRYLSGELVITHKGTVVVKDKDGNFYQVSKDDPRYLSGELVHINCGTVIVKDKDGNRFAIEKTDSRYLSGELVSEKKGTVIVKDKDGNKFSVEKTDPRYLSGELVHIATGKIAAKDKDGNFYQVSKDDPRYLSGELVGIRSRKFTVKNKDGKLCQVS